MDETSDEIKERLQSFLTSDHEGRWPAGEWMVKLMPHIRITDVKPAGPHPSVTFSFMCRDEHCNRLGNLHGGAHATLFDFCTTMSIVLQSRRDFWQLLGVTRSLNVTYFRPVPKDEEVIIEVETVQIGKRLATLRGVMKRKRDGAIVSQAEHLKANIDPGANL